MRQALSEFREALAPCRRFHSSQAGRRSLLLERRQRVNERLSAAYSSNNSAAVAQLQPTQVKLQGTLSGSPWAGLGETPPQPFALPEIPTVFLNIPA